MSILHVLQGGHGRLFQYRDCPCEFCTECEIARNYENNLRAHVQDLEERSNSWKLAEARLEIDVELEVKTEPMEYFSSDEETSFGRRIDANSVSVPVKMILMQQQEFLGTSHIRIIRMRLFFL